MSGMPSAPKYVVIGVGIHGLSAGWHLALELERRKRGSGRDVIVLDKTGVGGGASGIACGCLRNLSMTEPFHAILRHSVDVWPRPWASRPAAARISSSVRASASMSGPLRYVKEIDTVHRILWRPGPNAAPAGSHCGIPRPPSAPRDSSR